jgi:Putative  PD-(D/E)XK family member, (DUF4420)
MSENFQPDQRHLSTDSFERCLRSWVPMEHPIKGKPIITLFIDPDRRELGIRIPAPHDYRPEDTGRENVLLRVVQRPEGRFLEIVVDDSSLFIGAYPVLRSIADLIQLDGMDVMSALSSTIRSLDQLLKRDVGLSVEREIGLLGELLILRQLCTQLAIADAIATWRGSDSEEHDFSIFGIDVEAKTTSAERRTHWVASLTQLVQTGARPLWLVSQQVTRAGAGNGRSLRELITEIREIVGNSQIREMFECRLADAGWAEPYERSVHGRWLMRTPPQAYLIGPGFPQLTPSLLADAGISLIRIPDVRYRVDLTGLEVADQVPGIIDSILSTGDLL